MSVTQDLARTHAVQGRSFYLVLALILAAIAIFGFAHTIPGDFEIPGFPALLIAHGIVFTAWVLLFVAQPSLIMARSLKWHRRLGWAGVALAATMVLLAAGAILLALWAKTLPPFYPPGLFIVRGTFAVLVFLALVTAEVRLRRHSAWHKRLMLCAAIVIVVPGLERAMPIPSFGTDWSYIVDAVVDALALAGPAFDLITTRRVHPAYLWGVGAIIAGQALTDLLSPTFVALAMLRVVGA